MGLVIFRLQSLLGRNKGKRTFRARFFNQNNGDFFTSCDVGWPHWIILLGLIESLVCGCLYDAWPCMQFVEMYMYALV